MTAQPPHHRGIAVGRTTLGLFLGPWLLGTVGWVMLPAAASLVLSLTRFDGSDWNHIQWVGTDNYRALLGATGTSPSPDAPWYIRLADRQPRDPLFYKSLYNTLVYACTAAPLSVAAALLMAWLLYGPIRGRWAFRALVYMPHVLGGVATILIWSWILNPRFGPVNTIIRGIWNAIEPAARLVGLSSSDWPIPGWFMSATWCKPALVVINVWTAGGAAFVFLAAMARIDPQLDDAARLDGATTWRRFRYIRVPLLTPVILFNLLTSLSASIQAFNQAYLLQNRAQNDSLLLCPLLIYRYAFEPPCRFGYASAMSWVLFVLLAALGVMMLRSARRWVHYES